MNPSRLSKIILGSFAAATLPSTAVSTAGAEESVFEAVLVDPGQGRVIEVVRVFQGGHAEESCKEFLDRRFNGNLSDYYEGTGDDPASDSVLLAILRDRQRVLEYLLANGYILICERAF